MRSKTLATLAAAFLMLSAGCSTLEKIVYRPDINQGNYLTSTDVSKLQKGMSKQQVAYLLGTPMMQDPFGSNTWIYVFRQQPGHQDVKQQTLTLTFDQADQLLHIQNDFKPGSTPAQSAEPAPQTEQPPTSGQEKSTE